MPIFRGAFGNVRQGPHAVGGQVWIEGSHPDFLGWSRGEELERWFPDPSSNFARVRPDWPGLIHVWCRRRDFWHVCLAFRPTFSSARSTPLWLLAKIPAPEFSSGMLLARVISQMISAAAQIEQSEVGAEAWLRHKDPEPGLPAGLDDFRVALALDRQSASAGLALSDITILRGIQVRLEAEVEALPATSQPRVGAILRPMPSGKPDANQAPRIVDLAFGESKIDVTSVHVRGVSDDALLARGTPVQVLATAIAARAKRGTGRLADCIQVPVHLLERGMVLESEINSWAESVSRDPERLERELNELIAGGRSGIAKSARLLAALLCRVPAARRGETTPILELFERIGISSLLAQPAMRVSEPPL
jgi:hypothetical protein